MHFASQWFYVKFVQIIVKLAVDIAIDQEEISHGWSILKWNIERLPMLCERNCNYTAYNILSTAEFSWWRFIHSHLNLPDSVGYLCSRMSPENYSRPWSTPTSEPPFISQIMPTQRHRPPQSAPNLMGFATTACSHKVHSWGVAVGYHTNSQIDTVYAPAETTQVLQWRWEAAPLRTMPQGGTPSRVPPICTFNAGGVLKTCGFFPQNLFYISGDFNTFGPFPERIVLFQVSGTVYDA